MMTKCKYVLYSPIMWIMVLMYVFCPEKQKVNMDIERFCSIHRRNTKNLLCGFYAEFIGFREFRSLFYYRFGRWSRLVRWLMPGEPLLGFGIKSGKIGGGLFIQHGYATDIEAESIGENCWINQKVSIAYKGQSKPTIGNNVRIGVGAIIIGDVRIGDNVNIGAGAIVVKDVPNNCTVVSSSTYIVKRNGERVLEKL